jgi:hypothetical protein
MGKGECLGTKYLYGVNLRAHAHVECLRLVMTSFMRLRSARSVDGSE